MDAEPGTWVLEGPRDQQLTGKLAPQRGRKSNFDSENTKVDKVVKEQGKLEADVEGWMDVKPEMQTSGELQEMMMKNSLR
ncbi:hypothetical protein NDU88_000150 [Pleurodeles waltl]|uniref:Uncharacterized protein n=1 Tax=Pleurodeles waltl TaxID=8319 RepID=A0AAV7KLL0_PLEWA|nr:hypothetical protein NDU88_000150 [Pleurodeles waltl]